MHFPTSFVSEEFTIGVPARHVKAIIPTCSADGKPVVVQLRLDKEGVHKGEEREERWEEVTVHCCLSPCVEAWWERGGV